MNPTLENGDNLWVDKLSYTFGDPKRFDIVIFNYDENTTVTKIIKKLILTLELETTF